MLKVLEEIFKILKFGVNRKFDYFSMLVYFWDLNFQTTNDYL